MLEHGVTLHPLKQRIAERELVRVGRYVYAGHREEVEIHESRHRASGASDVQIPAAERKILRLTRIHDEGRGRLQRAP